MFLPQGSDPWALDGDGGQIGRSHFENVHPVDDQSCQDYNKLNNINNKLNNNNDNLNNIHFNTLNNLKF